MAFPPGEPLFAGKPFHRGLYAGADAIIGRGECPEGRFDVETPDIRLSALIHESSPWLAGYIDGRR